jgi:H+-translocating NAD(P) transhydrogenase subunit alpha
MTVTVGAVREVEPGETRVALVPVTVPKLAVLGAEVAVESGAGLASFIEDVEYDDVRVLPTAAEVYAAAGVVLKVQPPTPAETAHLRAGAVLVSLIPAHKFPDRVAALRDRGVTAFAMELLPRITRAQPMDVLSSQAAIGGQKAALMAACALGRLLPMFTSAVGTIRPAKVVVLGAGVAGLQAIATAHRFGAVVEAYDVRAATREHVLSVGGRFIDMPITAEGEGGYARELTEEEHRIEAETLAEHIVGADAVITTAAVPGKPSPILIPASVVERMKRGSVIVDLAAEGGGNCELTRPGATIERHGVIIVGPLNVPALLPSQASDMYAKNLANFVALLVKDGAYDPDWDDEVVAGTALVREGVIVHEPSRLLVEEWEAAGGGRTLEAAS